MSAVEVVGGGFRGLPWIIVLEDSISFTFHFPDWLVSSFLLCWLPYNPAAKYFHLNAFIECSSFLQTHLQWSQPSICNYFLVFQILPWQPFVNDISVSGNYDLEAYDVFL